MDLTTLSRLDTRDLDCVHLGRIAGADYYEVHQVLRVDGETRTIVGRASDWPILARDARIRELELLTERLTRHASEADAHVVDLIEERDALKARLQAAEQAPAVTVAAVEPPSDGKVACDECGARVWPRGLNAHKTRKHPAAPAVASPPTVPITPIALALGEAPWRCVDCGSDTHTRSLSDTTRCMRCAADHISSHRNGHLVAA